MFLLFGKLFFLGIELYLDGSCFFTALSIVDCDVLSSDPQSPTNCLDWGFIKYLEYLNLQSQSLLKHFTHYLKKYPTSLVLLSSPSENLI